MKKFFKGLSKKIKVGIGAVTLFLGLGGAYWAYERVGFEVNVYRYDQKFDSAVFVGDTGEDSAIRKKVLASIHKLKPKFVFLLGDLGYPTGIENQKDFDRHVRPFLGTWETHCIFGNHDSMASSQKERDWLAHNANKNGCRFDNSYKLMVFQDACVLTMDSTVYYVGKEHNILANQEAFLKKGLAFGECQGKRPFLLAHHNLMGFGGHKNDVSDRHKKFALGLKAAHPKLVVVHGHEHLMANYWYDFYTFGSGGKKDECDYQPVPGWCRSAPGYGVWDGAHVQATMVGEGNE